MIFFKVLFNFFWSIKSLRKIMLTEPVAKLTIIFGVIKWTDLPHLHHPLIYLRILLEEARKD